MNRREAVQSITILTGGLLSASTIGVILNGCTSNIKTGKGIQFTEDEQNTVSRMADIIIPSTKIPGALNAGVPTFVIMMMQQCYPLQNQDSFHKGLGTFDHICTQKYSGHFLKLSKEKQVQAVKYLDVKILGKNNPAGQTDESLSIFYRDLKGLIILGYYSSKPGATEALRYIPVPGHYDGCIPYHTGDKEWAT